MAEAFPTEKMGAIAEVFIHHIGMVFTKDATKDKNLIHFKIRSDKINQAISFKFGNWNSNKD